jgi:hypothetical protein
LTYLSIPALALEALQAGDRVSTREIINLPGITVPSLEILARKIPGDPAELRVAGLVWTPKGRRLTLGLSSPESSGAGPIARADIRYSGRPRRGGLQAVSVRRPLDPPFPRWSSIEEVKRANAALGQTYFAPAEIRFFRSRIGRRLWGGRYFLTSEEPPHGSRAYSIREALPNGSIETIGRYQAHADRLSAERRVRGLLWGPNPLYPSAALLPVLRELQVGGTPTLDPGALYELREGGYSIGISPAGGHRLYPPQAEALWARAA